MYDHLLSENVKRTNINIIIIVKFGIFSFLFVVKMRNIIKNNNWVNNQNVYYIL